MHLCLTEIASQCALFMHYNLNLAVSYRDYLQGPATFHITLLVFVQYMSSCTYSSFLLYRFLFKWPKIKVIWHWKITMIKISTHEESSLLLVPCGTGQNNNINHCSVTRYCRSNSVKTVLVTLDLTDFVVLFVIYNTFSYFAHCFSFTLH